MLTTRGRGLVSALATPCERPQRWRSRMRWTCPRCVSRQFSVSSPALHHNVAVLGGGISGLTAAYYITRQHPTARVTIYEASGDVGGWAASQRVPVKGGTVLFESGPRSIRPNGNGVLTARLMQELNLTEDAIFTQKTAPAARSRYIYYQNRMVRMPHPAFGMYDNLWSVLREPVFSGLIWGLGKDFFSKARDRDLEDQSIGDFISRRFQPQLVDRLVSAVMHGIYAGDVWKLSARSLLPGAWHDDGTDSGVIMGAVTNSIEGPLVTQREANFLSDMKAFRWDPLLRATLKDNSVFTFKDGMQTLLIRLSSVLFGSGQVTFKMNTPVERLDSKDGESGITVHAKDTQGQPAAYSHVISALSLPRLNSIFPVGSQSLPEVEAVTVMTINLYFRTPGLHQAGFGYLIPQAVPLSENPERALGVVFDTAYSPSAGDANPSNWHDFTTSQLKTMREAGQLLNVNDFSWYNFPNAPNVQDHVETRGTKVTVMLGGHYWNGLSSYPDEKEGLALARSVLEKHLGITEEPEAWRVNLNRDCIPQYHVGHQDRLQLAHSKIKTQFAGRLRVVGNWMSGVGVNDCIRSAYDIAKNLNTPDRTGLEHVGELPTLRIAPPGRKSA